MGETSTLVLPPTIVVLEDDQDIIFLTTAWLDGRRECIHVLTARSSHDARALCHQHADTLFAIICDHNVLDGTTDDLIVELRNQFPSLIIIFTTADDLDTCPATLRNAISRYFQKPTDFNAMVGFLLGKLPSNT